ncbi:MAG: M1 family aminopeptidase [Gammaproteobacteria bacterium]
MIITPDEALDNENTKDGEYRTWKYSATQVRDFAFASSRKFIWDAMGVVQKGMDGKDHTIMAMSYYPKEANPLWGIYSTQVVAHTLNTYSRFTFPYPYPVALSVNGATGGMEYPMIAFTHTRPTKNDAGEQTYTRQLKYAVISVVMHEVGHNYFPMIINTDERHWSWMDEGMNTFIGHLALQEWEPDYPIGRGGPRGAIAQMTSPRQMPIMTSADSLINRGGNAYAKTSAALMVLRETILKRELFDYAFKEYARRWMFKRPAPTDFFRTMEDVSGVDLDWFWNGWFYSTDHVDIALDKVSRLRINTQDPEIEKAWQEEEKKREPQIRVRAHNGDIEFMLDRHPELADFYNEHGEFTVTNKDRNKYNNMLDNLEDYERELLKVDNYIYQLDFTNKGGLVMPIILDIEYADGEKEALTLPAEIWAKNTSKVSSRIIRDKEILSVQVDPHWETGDVERHDNHYPRIIETVTLELTIPEEQPNLMEDVKVELEGNGKLPIQKKQ